MSVSCYRWSESGFNPCTQTFLKKETNDILKSKKRILSSTPEHLQNYELRNHKSKEIDPTFSFKGIFVFIQKPEKGDYLLYLNHLKEKPDFKNDFHQKEFNDDTIVYLDDGIVNRKRNKMTLKEAFDKGREVVFIPS